MGDPGACTPLWCCTMTLQACRLCKSVLCTVMWPASFPLSSLFPLSPAQASSRQTCDCRVYEPTMYVWVCFRPGPSRPTPETSTPAVLEARPIGGIVVCFLNAYFCPTTEICLHRPSQGAAHGPLPRHGAGAQRLRTGESRGLSSRVCPVLAGSLGR